MEEIIRKKQGDLDSYGNVIDWDTTADQKDDYIGEDNKESQNDQQSE